MSTPSGVSGPGLGAPLVAREGAGRGRLETTSAMCAKAYRRSTGGEGFVIHICPDCGYAEGEIPQARCCPHCGRSSDPLVCWATVSA